MSVTIRPEVFRRMVFAKSLLQSARVGCSDQDPYIFARGLLLLHDTAESALGAIADQTGAKLSPQTYLLDYYGLIEAADSSKRKVPYYTQMRNLNTIRVNIKHHGIFPDRKSNEHLVSAVADLLESLCQAYLETNLGAITLASLIRDDKVRGFVELAEREFEEGKYEDCLVSLGYAMYHIVESTAVPWFTDLFKPEEEKRRLLYTEPYTTNYSVKLIQHGVDPYTYHRFRNLTPRMAFDRETKKVIYDWDKSYGHKANWTQRNARFCLAFCVDTALRVQKLPEYDYGLIPFEDVCEDVIETIGETATIWDAAKSGSDLRSVFAGSEPRSRKALRILKQGEQIIGRAYSSEDNSDEWWISVEEMFGYVAKSEVNVTTREKQPKNDPLK